MSKIAETTFVGAQVPKELDDAITKLAEDNDRSRSAEIRLALKAHVAKRPPKAKASA